VSRDRREKASDVFRRSNLLFAQKVPFAEAFPEIEALKVEVNVSEAGSGGSNRRYSEDTLGEYVDCHNPLCFNGGLSLGAILRDMVRGRETSRDGSDLCQGYEGSPKGRRKYRECLWFFRWKVEVQYRSATGDATG